MDKVSSHVVRKVCQDELELLRGNAALSVFAEHLRIYIDQLLSLLYNICSILNVVLSPSTLSQTSRSFFIIFVKNIIILRTLNASL